jgi:hypothetical protein
MNAKTHFKSSHGYMLMLVYNQSKNTSKPKKKKKYNATKSLTMTKPSKNELTRQTIDKQ